MAKVVDNYVQPLGLHARVEDDAVITTQEVQLHEAKDGTVILLGSQGYGEDGVKYTITGLGTEYVWGRADDSTIDKRLKPEWLTSKRPDSWEQLEEDMSLVGCNKALVVGIVTKNEKGRFDCKIDCETCSRLTAEIFIRRAKVLAGAE